MWSCGSRWGTTAAYLVTRIESRKGTSCVRCTRRMFCRPVYVMSGVALTSKMLPVVVFLEMRMVPRNLGNAGLANPEMLDIPMKVLSNSYRDI